MRILIVDDESLNRFLLKHMLQEAGYKECYEAASGEQALSLAQQINPDIVLLDAIMPGMDGYDLAPELKRQAQDIYLPIIFITSLEDKVSLARCLEVGGDDFATKPFDKVILVAKIRAHARTRLLSKKIHRQNQELLFYRAAVKREHNIIEHIYANAINNNDNIAHLFDYCLTPATDFNGDLVLYEATVRGGACFLVGDFTGHGLASAIGALPVAKAFKAMVGRGVSVAEMVNTLNNTLLTLLPVDMFFAAVVVEISPCGHQLTIWNGGMPTALLLSSQGQVEKRFDSRHMALGILDSNEFDGSCEYYTASPGQRLLAFTDGLPEVRDPDGTMLGEENIEYWLAQNPNISARTMQDKVQARLAGGEQHDDITLLFYHCRELNVPVTQPPSHLLPFQLSLRLLPEDICSPQMVNDLVKMATNQQGLKSYRSQLYTVFAELFNNSLEHGLLKLDSSLKRDAEGFMLYYQERERRLESLQSGWIDVEVRADIPRQVFVICVADSGPGFDVSNLQQLDGELSYGRGIPLLKELCKSLEYSEGGSKATVEVAF